MKWKVTWGRERTFLLFDRLKIENTFSRSICRFELDVIDTIKQTIQIRSKPLF